MSILSIRTNTGIAGDSSRCDATRILSLETLWQQHFRQVYTLALWLLADANEAESLTAQVFQRAYQGMPNQPSNERSFLVALTIDRSLARLRNQERLLESIENTHPAPAISAAAIKQSSYPVDLEAHLLQLPDFLRVVFVLRDVRGLSNQEIADYLRTGEAYVQRVVHRARLALQRSLQARRQGK